MEDKIVIYCRVGNADQVSESTTDDKSESETK